METGGGIVTSPTSEALLGSLTSFASQRVRSQNKDVMAFKSRTEAAWQSKNRNPEEFKDWFTIEINRFRKMANVAINATLDCLQLKVNETEPRKGNYKGEEYYKEAVRWWKADAQGATKIIGGWITFFRDLLAMAGRNSRGNHEQVPGSLQQNHGFP